MFLIVGLGNPGLRYYNTRHNIGFLFIDEVVSRFKLTKLGYKNDSILFKGEIGNIMVLAAKPQTMMNNSGLAISKIKSFYKIPTDKIFVFYDEIDLLFLKLKIKKGGSSAGHNGVKSLDRLIGKDYYKIRIGIGKPLDKSLVSKHVLNNFSNTELVDVKEKIILMASFLEFLLEYKFDTFLNSIFRGETK